MSRSISSGSATCCGRDNRPTTSPFTCRPPTRSPISRRAITPATQPMDRLIGPAVVPQVLDAGYNFDFIDDTAIARAGVPYRILILPGVERMPLATLEKITKAGVTVIAR